MKSTSLGSEPARSSVPRRISEGTSFFNQFHMLDFYYHLIFVCISHTVLISVWFVFKRIHLVAGSESRRSSIIGETDGALLRTLSITPQSPVTKISSVIILSEI